MGGNKIGICEWVLPVDGPWVCKIAKELGFDGIQLELGDYERGFPKSRPGVRKAYLDAASQYGIEFASMATRVGDYYALVDEPGSRDHQIVREGLEAAIEACDEMGVERLMVPTFAKSAIRNDREFEIAVDVFQWACDFALDKGVVIAAENTLSVEKTRTFFQAVDRKNMVLYFDMQNYYLHNGDYTPDILEGLYDLVAEVHAKDGKGSDLSGALLGTGDVSFPETAQLLKQKGYSGWIVSENYYDLSPLAGPGDEPFRNAEKDLKTLRGIFSS